MPVIGDRDEGEEPERRQLLAVHEVRRNMEALNFGDRSAWCVSMTLPSRSIVGELLELIAALDRRAPQVHRAGEASIVRDAAALKARALRRIEELERRSIAPEKL